MTTYALRLKGDRAIREMEGTMSLPLNPNKYGKYIRCTICHKRKQPIGRSAPALTDGTLCGPDCGGFNQEPLSGSLWPEESEADFGYLVGDQGTEIRSPEGTYGGMDGRK